ncbi:peptidoglycan DD-metalloendopeptidase family protein [Lysinibacillus sp. FSL H8-0500]|uniref:peptidoglycan DD-metalloendopeptidase family protein n=1 Tax=Lysinibacillus sp. FSL H8-0500 TaxID=2921393 RepID=UPI003101945E
MSTGGEQKKPTELLIALGINEKISKKNIHTYLKQLKNIPSLTINLDVKGYNSQLFIDYGKQIQALEQQLDTLNGKLQNIGAEASAPLSIFENVKQQITDSIKSIDTLNKTFKDAKINVNSFYKQLTKVPTNDLQALKKLVSQLKAEIETATIDQFKLNGIQKAQQDLQTFETNLSSIYELQTSYIDTSSFEQLTAQITDLNNQLSDIQLGEGLNIADISNVSAQIEKMNQDIIEFGQNTGQAAQSSASLGSSIMDSLALTSTLKTIGEDISGGSAPIKLLRNLHGIGIVGGLFFDMYTEEQQKINQTVAEFEASQKAMLGLYSQNAETIDSLIPKYERLSKIVNDGNADNNTLKEHENIQNQLANLLPSLAASEDEYGKKIVGSAEAIKIKTQLLKEQQAIENKAASAKEVEARKATITKNEEELNKLLKKNEDELLRFARGNNRRNAGVSAEYKQKVFDKRDSSAGGRQPSSVEEVVDSFWGLFEGKPIYDSVEKLQKFLPELRIMLTEAKKSGTDTDVQYLESLIRDAERTLKLTKNPLNEINNLLPEIKTNYINNLEAIIEKNNALTGSTEEVAQALSAQLISTANADEIQNLNSALEALFKDKNAPKFVNDINKQLNQLYYAPPEEFEKMQKDASSYIENIQKKFKSAYPDMDDATLTNLQSGIKQYLASITKDYEKYGETMKATGLSLHHFTSSSAASGNELENLTTKMKNYQNVAEEEIGISSSYVDALNNSLSSYQEISMQLDEHSQQTLNDILNKEHLTTQEQNIKDLLDARYAIMQDLATVYPDLLKNDSILIGLSKEKINMMIAENNANEVLLKAYKLFRDGKLTAEQEATLASALGTKARIENLKSELEAIQKVSSSTFNKYEEIQAKYNRGEELTDSEGRFLLAASQSRGDYVGYGEYSEKLKALDDQISLLNTDIGKINGFTSVIKKNEQATNKSTTAQKNANTEKEKAIYITDKYKKKLEELNVQIAKQQKSLSKLPEHSSEYRQALETQIKFEKEKLKAMQQQETSLKNQIASGKIQKTGTITGSSSAQTTTSNQKLNGWSGTITSGYRATRIINNKTDIHRGIDIASPLGTRLDANISGKVIASGDAKANNMDSSYGNVVVIQDADNRKHIYAHLDKAIAKLGDTLVAGTQIGTIGSSGTSSGSHLHYEINVNGQPVDPSAFLKDAQNGKISIVSSSASSAVETTQAAIDQTISEVLNLQQQILDQQEKIEKLEHDIIESYLAKFEHQKTNFDNQLETSDNRLKRLTVSSESYRKELDKQASLLKDKRKVNQNEIAYLEGVIKSGTVSKKIVAEYTQRLHELNQVNSEIDFTIWDVGAKKLESYMTKFEEQRQAPNNTIAYEKAKSEELDTSSPRYIKTLANINNAMKEQQIANSHELTQLNTLVNGNKLFGDSLDTAKQRIKDLTVEMKELQIAIQNGDYDILINIKTQSDEKVKNIESEINRAELIRKMFDEGSSDYEKYTDIMIDGQKRIAQQHLQTRDNLLEELQQRDITAERIKEVIDLINNEYNAYLNATVAIKEYNKQKNDAKEAQLKDIADKVINAYKDYYQELKDEHMKQLDEEIERENKKHETIMKNLQDEMDLFRKSVEDKLRLLDRQEAQRSYDMEIEDLETERADVQSQFNILALDNSHEAKAKRKKLQEQLDEIDKNIAEKRHNREIELRKESLNDALEAKEEETDEKIELQEAEHENLINKIEREKEYWESYYNDLLNDEREFAKMRESIIDGHLENVEADLKQFQDKMKATLPDMGRTLEGTMDAVGLSIKNNVIFNLEEALALIDKFNISQKPSDKGLFETTPHTKQNTQTSTGNLSEGDLQVLLGKFLFDKVLPNASGTDKNTIRQKATQLADQGRKDSKNPQFTKDGVNFENAFNTLTHADKDAVYEYFNSNKGILGGKYNHVIEQFISSISGNKYEATNSKNNQAASLSTADMQVMLGKFIYEKLIPDATLNANTKTALKNKADYAAAQGRADDSEISKDVTFDSVKNTYTSAQIDQLKSFFNANLNLIDNTTTRELMKNKIASLNTGGFMNWTGIGIDGKGGKAIIAHPHEIMLNKADTRGLFNSINIMDRVMSSLAPFFSKFVPSAKTSPLSGGDTYGNIEIHFNVDKMNGDSNDLKRFSKMIDDDLLRRKGMRI